MKQMFRLTRERRGTEGYVVYLAATDDTRRVWTKEYENYLPLGFDAVALDLVQDMNIIEGLGGVYQRRFKTTVAVDEEVLERFRFRRATIL